jgi:uncharacterized protein
VEATLVERRLSAEAGMADSRPKSIKITVDDKTRVSGLFHRPRGARTCFVVAHGAGAGIEHPFMFEVASGLAARGMATLRYQFPYMERGSKRPDSPATCHATVKAAVLAARRLAPSLPLIAGGKSFGGRMTSQTQADAPLASVCGLAFLGFPLHPAKKPADARAQHLFEVNVPMLFLQGERDALADVTLLRRLVKSLGSRANLKWIQDADHSFHVPARSGRTDEQARDEMLDALAAWAATLC